MPPAPLLRPIHAYASSTRSGGNLVTEVEGLQLYLSKQSSTGVCGRESHPNPGTPTPAPPHICTFGTTSIPHPLLHTLAQPPLPPAP